jgi:GNAT superfamily N-acetyltransferase/acyl-coenzyme A thioesterase PaaI-like protein
MKETGIVNRDRMPGNVCWGCGADNSSGLHAEFRRDPESPERLLGTFRPRAEMIGFPGITHGGAIFTALDCLAAWVAATLRPEARSLWLLRRATMTYHAPAFAGRPLALSGSIGSEEKAGGPIVVRAEARDAEDRLLAEGEFKVVPLAPERFLGLTGLPELPENWIRLLEEGRREKTAAPAARLEVRVRPARAEDREFVLSAAARLADFGPPPWRTVPEVIEGERRCLRGFFDAPDPKSALLVAESGAGPLGFVYLETQSDYFTRREHGHIGILAVSREGEGRGVGGALLEASDDWARSRGFEKITLAVFEGNRHARSVYARRGFVPEVLRYVKLLGGA